MSELPRIVSIGAVDARGIAGTSGLRATWEQLGVRALGTGRTFRALFGRTDQTYRRLDDQTRALVLAAEACGLEALLSPATREETGLVVETSRGCIEVDLRYTRSLADGIVQGAIFPYTLQSTCLGDVALRMGLRGPTISLSIAPGEEGEALREARRLLATGAARHVAVGTTDALGEPLPSATPFLRAVVALVVAPGEPYEALLPWPEEHGEPFAALADACHRLAGAPPAG